jgi:hypothetical protein
MCERDEGHERRIGSDVWYGRMLDDQIALVCGFDTFLSQTCVVFDIVTETGREVGDDFLLKIVSRPATFEAATIGTRK